ncbi:MAG: hypothetical protein V3V04_07150 [Rhizobiaceae bacterium]
MNKQVMANNILRANHARNQMQTSMIVTVCLVATLAVGVTSILV